MGVHGWEVRDSCLVEVVCMGVHGWEVHDVYPLGACAHILILYWQMTTNNVV